MAPLTLFAIVLCQFVDDYPGVRQIKSHVSFGFHKKIFWLCKILATSALVLHLAAASFPFQSLTIEVFFRRELIGW